MHVVFSKVPNAEGAKITNRLSFGWDSETAAAWSGGTSNVLSPQGVSWGLLTGKVFLHPSEWQHAEIFFFKGGLVWFVFYSLRVANVPFHTEQNPKMEAGPCGKSWTKLG